MRLLAFLFLLPTLAHAQWAPAANENQSFTLTAESVVRYGARDNWITVTRPAGTHACSNEAFGADPVRMVVKSCQRRLPTCAPKDLKGTGTVALIDTNAQGAAVGWWCPGALEPTVYAAQWGWMAANPAALSVITGLPYNTAPADAIAQLERAHPTTWEGGAAAFPGLTARLAAAKPPATPPPAFGPYRVVKAPSNASPAGTRPIYRRSAADNLVTDYGRVGQFAACDCNLDRFPATGAPTHCSVNGMKEQLALCERVP